MQSLENVMSYFFQSCFVFLFFIFNIFYWLCYHSCPIFPSLFPSTLHTPSHCIYHVSSCLRVIHISSLASTFPILFLTSPCLFSTYHLCYLFPVPFFPLSTSPSLPHWQRSIWSPFLWIHSCSSCLLSSFLFLFFF